MTSLNFQWIQKKGCKMLLFKQKGQELIQTTSPGQPFMSGAFRQIIGVVDATSCQPIAHGFHPLGIFLRADTYEKGMHLLVEGLAVFKHTVIGCLQFGLGIESAATTECPDMREFVQVGQCDLESLVTTPGQTCHGATISIIQRPEVLFNIGNDFGQQVRGEICTKFGSGITLALTGFCTKHGCNTAVTDDYDHGFCLGGLNQIVCND